MYPAIIRGAALAALALASLAAQAASYGSNLIVNGDAENGTTGWSTYDGTSSFDAVAYGSNWVLPSQPGPVDRGSYLFVGGSGNAYAAGYQTVDLSSFSSAIAAGQVSYTLSGWIGGWTTQLDNALLYVTFQDAANNVIGTTQIGPNLPADRNGISGLYFTSTSGLLPVGTASVTFSLSMERASGGDNDGYADNLSFTLAAVPEPATQALMLAGLAAVGGLAARRGRRA